MHHHVVLGAGVILPAVDRLQVHRAELPAAHRIIAAGLEPTQLFVLGDREPVLAQNNPVVDEHLLEDRTLPQEQGVLLRSAETHDPFHAGPVVPGAVEQHDLALGRQVFDIALEVPLPAFALAGSRQGGDAHRTGAEVLGDPLDGPALAGGVTTFEDHHDPRTGRLDPLLQLDEFGLQPEQLGLVDVVRNLRGRLRVRIGFALAHGRILRLRRCYWPAASINSARDSANSSGSTSTSLIASRSALMPKYSIPQ